ncbi:MAG: dUTP diphosphatase [Tenericutes bacterium HGW-Tenericutes-3]|nr:MAG: dUTP diphosphatase [Tenericutes bacterium HGW-Tenericutes-3]
MRKFEVITKYKELGVSIPKRATDSSAGYDLASVEDLTIEPGEIRMVPTGLKVMMPKTEALFIFARSSLSIKKGLIMSNSVGVVDADYYGNPDNEGHLMVSLMNVRNEPVQIKKGERVAQGIFLKYEKTTDDETNGNVRLGGFGSSGI